MAAPTPSSSIQSEAFKRLYPQQYYAAFLAQGMRPDGRTLATPRPISLTRGVVGPAAGSALARVGGSAALAGVSADWVPGAALGVEETLGGASPLTVQVDLAPMCSPGLRPQRRAPEAARLTEELQGLLEDGRVLDWESLYTWEGGEAGGEEPVVEAPTAHGTGRAADGKVPALKGSWKLSLDIYVLSADGALMDVCLLAAVAALQDTALAVPAGDGEAASSVPGRRLRLRCTPCALTCGAAADGRLVVDPGADEEALLDCLAVAVLDETDAVLSFKKPGGGCVKASLLPQVLRAAQLRARDVRELLASEG